MKKILAVVIAVLSLSSHALAYSHYGTDSGCNAFTWTTNVLDPNPSTQPNSPVITSFDAAFNSINIYDNSNPVSPTSGTLLESGSLPYVITHSSPGIYWAYFYHSGSCVQDFYQFQIATATSPESTTTYMLPISHDEILFFVMIFIILLAVPFWRFLFSGWRK